MSAETPPQVAASAQIEDALPLNELALIGLFGTPDGASALVRAPDGDILRLVAGDQALGLTVTAIDDTALHFVDASGAPSRLTMPGTP